MTLWQTRPPYLIETAIIIALVLVIVAWGILA
jgi:hypothetical protein